MAYTFNIKVADLTFQVTTVYPYSMYYCKQYHIDEIGEHKIVITQEHIDAERQRCEELEPGVDPFLQTTSDGFIESVALLRVLADYIPAHNRILMHGSAIAINGNGYIFTALSGTGKSTHTGLLRQLHGENAVMINDDKPFLFVKGDDVFVCGTPWMGKHRLGNNIIVPLKGIFFLRRSDENVLNEISANDALAGFIGQCHRPSDPNSMLHSLDIMDKVLSKVSLYDFGCNMDISAAHTSSSVMK